MSYVVKVPLEKFFHQDSLTNIECLVRVTHKTRILATKALNICLRNDIRSARSDPVDFSGYFKANWVKQAFIGTSGSKGAVEDA
jgi:hypothetical protein